MTAAVQCLPGHSPSSSPLLSLPKAAPREWRVGCTAERSEPATPTPLATPTPPATQPEGPGCPSPWVPFVGIGGFPEAEVPPGSRYKLGGTRSPLSCQSWDGTSAGTGSVLPSRGALRGLEEGKAAGGAQLGRVSRASSESTAGENAKDPPDLLPKNPPPRPPRQLPRAQRGRSRDTPASPRCWLLPPRAPPLQQSQDNVGINTREKYSFFGVVSVICFCPGFNFWVLRGCRSRVVLGPVP